MGTSSAGRDQVPLTIRGRRIGKRELTLIRRVVRDLWGEGRSAISRQVCAKLGWRQVNERLKDRACRDLLVRLADLDLIALPPSKVNGNGARREAAAPSRAVLTRIEELERGRPITQACPVRFEMVRLSPNEELWNALVRRHHYLGHRTIVGRHLKYIVYSDATPIACLGWGEAAWHLQPRDRWIGWDDSTRRRNLRLVVGNVRFLILPWVRVKNLASRLLAAGARRVCMDWMAFYGEVPVLLETFVDRSLFLGTCYKAANWLSLGETTGWGKRGPSYYQHGTKKEIFIYPLVKDARQRLCNGHPSPGLKRPDREQGNG